MSSSAHLQPLPQGIRICWYELSMKIERFICHKTLSDSPGGSWIPTSNPPAKVVPCPKLAVKNQGHLEADTRKGGKTKTMASGQTETGIFKVRAMWSSSLIWVPSLD